VADAGWRIEPLAERHVRDLFRGGEPALDEFLRKYARQNERRGIGRTSVAVRPGDPRVLGYYTVRAGAVGVRDLPEDEARRLPRYPVPVVHLARLAVDETATGQGLGERLLVDALTRAHRVSAELGAYAVEVVAKSEAAKRFYEKYGFRTLTDDRLHLYLSMKTIARLFPRQR